MKELSIEQKAKRYDEAIKRAKAMIKVANNQEEAYNSVITIFPELKEESEDERIRKELIDFVKSRLAGFPDCKRFTDWLERQGEHANFRNKIQIGDKVTKNRDGVLVNLSQLNRVAKVEEKQGEQKPADKVIEEEKSLLERFKQAVYDCAWEKVTCTKEGETKEEYANRWAEQLLVLVRDWADDYIDSREDVIRRRFFDKGKQSMYKPAWSEEDEEMLKMVIKLCEQCGNEYAYYWLKSIKDRILPQLKQEWSEKDENRINRLIAYFEDKESFTAEDDVEYANWLKSLRPQKCLIPSEEEIEKAAQEWDSKANFNPFYMTMDGDKPTGVKQDITTHKESFKAGVNWILKSLRPHSQWKPSDEQIHWLKWCVNRMPDTEKANEAEVVLEELLEQLKKLREE